MTTCYRAGFGLQQIAGALWKQRLLWALLWVLATAVVLGAVHYTPSRYKTVAILAVEPAASVARTGEAELRTQLHLARLKVLQRDRLLDLIRRAHPERAARWRPQDAPYEVEDLRERVNITTIPDPRGARFSAVQVTLEYPDPARAARVVNRIAEALAREFNELGKAGKPGAAADRRATAWAQLAECQRALAQFEKTYGRDLEDREKLLTAERNALLSQLAAADQTLNRLAQQQVRIEQALEQARTSQAEQSPNASPALPPRTADSLRALREKLASLLAHYTETHPDVRRLREELAQAETLATETGIAATPVAPKASPTAEQLKGELAQLARQREDAAGERIRLARMLATTDAELRRIASLKRRQAELARECAVAEASYREAAAKASDPPTPAVRLVMLEEALPPQRPVGPNRRALAIIGALLALIPCALVAIGRELGAMPVLIALGIAPPSANGTSRKPVAAAAAAAGRSGTVTRAG